MTWKDFEPLLGDVFRRQDYAIGEAGLVAPMVVLTDYYAGRPGGHWCNSSNGESGAWT